MLMEISSIRRSGPLRLALLDHLGVEAEVEIQVFPRVQFPPSAG